MNANLEEDKIKKQKVADGFDSIADCYDHTALRFFPFCADRLVKILKPKSNSKILDVATGTGVVAIAMAQAIKAGGRVLAIDLSENMLTQAGQSVQKMGLTNIDFFSMDAESLEFKNNYFDAVTCSFGLFFMPNMDVALQEWRRVTKPGGTVLFTSFSGNSFRPMVEYFIDDINEFGSELEASSIAGQRLKDPDLCVQLMGDAGFEQSEIVEIQVGYHLQNTEEWWQVLWNSGFRHYLTTLPEGKLEQFRRHHLGRVAELVTDKGLWMDVSVLVTTGRA